MEFEGLAWPLSCRHSHAIVKVGSGLQVLVRLLFQLLTELLSFYSTDVCYREGQSKQETVKATIFCAYLSTGHLYNYLSV